MSQLEIVFGYTKQIEALLEKDFNAQGRGLHTKVSSIEHRLPEALVKKIRWIATIRNNLAHTEGFTIENITDFTNTCDSVLSDLEYISKQNFLVEKQSGDWKYAAREIEHRVKKPLFSSERITHDKKGYSRRPAIAKRKPSLKSSLVMSGIFSLIIISVVLVWRGHIPVSRVFRNPTLFSESRNVRVIDKQDIYNSNQNDQALAQAYSDIDNGILNYIARNTKT